MMRRMRRVLCGLLVAVAGCAGTAPTGVPLPEWNARFERDSGWTGGDGAYSVDLGDGRVLWLFGDSWIGSVVDGAHKDARIVRNAIALQTGDRLQFGEDAFFRPPDGTGWFWPMSGFARNGRLHLFLNHMVEAGRSDIWNFRELGTYLATVENAREAPDRWRVDYRIVPHGSWGVCAFVEGETAYIYGVHESKDRRDRSWRVAQVPADHPQDFSDWQIDSRDLFWKAGAEGSVHRSGDHYVAVYTESGMSERILMRTAPSPDGPFGEPSVVYRCPEVDRDPSNFCYSAKAHPAFSGNGCLVVSYCVNSFDFWKTAADARIYRPRFIQVPAPR